MIFGSALEVLVAGARTSVLRWFGTYTFVPPLPPRFLLSSSNETTYRRRWTDSRCSRHCRQVPVELWERVLHDALWPRGPLHATSALVLDAKREMVNYSTATGPDPDGESTSQKL